MRLSVFLFLQAILKNTLTSINIPRGKVFAFPCLYRCNILRINPSNSNIKNIIKNFEEYEKIIIYRGILCRNTDIHIVQHGRIQHLDTTDTNGESIMLRSDIRLL